MFGMLGVTLACTLRPDTSKGLPERCLCRACWSRYCRRNSVVNSKDRRLPQSTKLEAFHVVERQRPLTSQAEALCGIYCARAPRTIDAAKKREGTNVSRENGILVVCLFLISDFSGGRGDSTNILSEPPYKNANLAVGRSLPNAVDEARPTAKDRCSTASRRVRAQSAWVESVETERGVVEAITLGRAAAAGGRSRAWTSDPRVFRSVQPREFLVCVVLFSYLP